MSPLPIESGQILVYQLFTLADTVDLDRLSAALGVEAIVSPFTSRRPTPQYIQFRNPPITLPMGDRPVTLAPYRPLTARVTAKVFDFGVLSVRWSFPAPETFEELVLEAGHYIDNAELEAASRQIVSELRPRLAMALKNPRKTQLFEDYTIFHVSAFQEPQEADILFKREAGNLAQLLRGERKPLSNSEQNEVLRARVSYYEDDLAVIDWNSAFIYDPEGGSEHLDTLEFANAELLELRYYDRLLDEQLDAVYQAIARGQALPRWRILLRNDYHQTLQRLMAITMDVIELTEQIDNALKFIGDLYSARVYRLIADRLRLREWEGSIDGKIQTAQQVFQMLTDQVDTRRSFALEVIIILLIALEIAMALSRH
jgi:hypothetical protein